MSINTKKIGAENSKFGYPNTTDMPRNPPIIEDGVQLGARVSIMPGITVGKCAIVDAGSFITKSVKAESHVRSSNIAASEL